MKGCHFVASAGRASLRVPLALLGESSWAPSANSLFMNIDSVASTLATAFLAGELSLDAVPARGFLVLQREWRWNWRAVSSSSLLAQSALAIAKSLIFFCLTLDLKVPQKGVGKPLKVVQRIAEAPPSFSPAKPLPVGLFLQSIIVLAFRPC